MDDQESRSPRSIFLWFIAILVPVATAILIPTVAFFGGQTQTLVRDVAALQPEVENHEKRLDHHEQQIEANAKTEVEDLKAAVEKEGLLQASIAGLTSAVEALTREFQAYIARDTGSGRRN